MANRIKLKGTSERTFDIGLTNKQTFDASGLTASRTWVLPNSNGASNNVLTTNGSGTLSWTALSSIGVSSITLTQPAAGITLTNSGVTQTGAATSTVALANDLAAVEGLSTTGLATRTASDTWTTRTITGTASRLSVSNGNGVSGNPTLDIDAAYVGQSSITTLGTISSGTWQGGIVQPTYGGTGVNNGSNTLTLGGNLTTSGAFASTFTMTGITTVTFPTTGTLATTANTVASFSAGTTGFTPNSATTGAVTLSGTLGSTNGGTGINNAGRTLTINTNSGTLSFTNAATTLTIANTGSISGTNTGDQTITLTGDVTGSGTGSFAATIGTNVVTNAKLAQVATATFKGRTTAGTGNVEDLTATQATALLNTFTTTLNGLVPAPGSVAGKVLSDNGTWITTSGAVSSVTGTANQVTSSPTTGAVVVSLPTTCIMPGTLEVTGKIIPDATTPSIQGPAGYDLALWSGVPPTSTSNGSTLDFRAGAGGLTSGNGGNVLIVAGQTNGGTTGGTVSIDGGPAQVGTGGPVNITGGNGNGTNCSGGNLTISGGVKNGSGTAGTVTVKTNNTTRLIIGAAGGWTVNGSEGSAGWVLTSNGAGSTPYWTAASASGVTSFSAGTTGFTPSSPTTGAIVLGGTLNIANGGTGQTSATAAFDALAPTNTNGDIIVRSGGTNTRLAVGATNTVLTVVGGAPAWATAASAFTNFTQDLGAADRAGTFDITGLSGLTADKNVQVMQTLQPIASKGNARDESEMDPITINGYVVNSTTIRCIWNAPSVVVGTYAFAYSVSA